MPHTDPPYMGPGGGRPDRIRTTAGAMRPVGPPLDVGSRYPYPAPAGSQSARSSRNFDSTDFCYLAIVLGLGVWAAVCLMQFKGSGMSPLTPVSATVGVLGVWALVRSQRTLGVFTIVAAGLGFWYSGALDTLIK
jgi:hypothetical protein